MKRFILSLAAVLTLAVAAMAADTAAQFPGGKDAMTQYVNETLKYPDAARENGIEGVVNVSFVVKADGSIGTIKIARLIDPDLEQEAIRIVKNMPRWTPATRDGKAVDSTVETGIVFELPAE